MLGHCGVHCKRAIMAVVALVLAAVAAAQPSRALDDALVRRVVENYANIALATYGDALSAAKALKVEVDKLAATPSQEQLDRTRKAWIAARVPYQQSEAFRFGNKIVDDWEGKVNSWPLDEGLIDYVAGEYGTQSETNTLYVANVIANTSLVVMGKKIDTSTITKALLSETLQEAEGVEANVATGYHAIEFLLWGQDLNGTGPGRGNRPATDFDVKNCTGGNCDRRSQYLRVATDLLVDDLTWMVSQWEADGDARKALASSPPDQAVAAIFTGLGSLSYGELAGERMKLGLLLHDPEEEHDCFSDNTHASHYNDVIGIQNVYLGHYKKLDGSMVRGPSVSDLVRAASIEADNRLREALTNTVTAFKAIVDRAETVEAYDQMIGEGNETGNRIVNAAIESLLLQTKEIERAIAALALKPVQFVGSDSLDDPSKIGK